MNDIIQLKITLKRTKPPIWRRVLVDRSTTFLELHRIILPTMGWMGGHLYEFEIGGYMIGLEDNGDGMGSDLDPSKEKLGEFIGDQKGSFSYTYDFGDDWEHVIKIEKFLPKEKAMKYPVCIGGALNCPPEDCGGVDGFYDLLEAVKNKKHPEHKETMEWLGGSYDPEYFDLEAINRRLSGKRQG